MTENTNIQTIETDSASYACCGNCRYFDGEDWCGLHRCRTTGGDSCSSHES